jgi:hypothetical protein
VIAVNAPGIPAGTPVPCTVRLGYGNRLTASWSGSVLVPSPPRTRLIHTGPGAYAAIPSSGIPEWAIALIVIGVLALAAAAALLLQMRRRATREVSLPGFPGRRRAQLRRRMCARGHRSVRA